MRRVKQIFDGNGNFDHYEDLVGQELADAESGVLRSEGRSDGEGGTLHVLYTAQQETDRDAEEAVDLAKIPMQVWAREMASIDNEGMDRTIEDILDTWTAAERAQLAVETKDRYDRKKAKRAQKP